MQRLVWWIQWHRRIGALIAVLVLLLAATGILINHSQSLGWHLAPVYSSMLARLYGIPRTPVESGFPADERWLVQVGTRLYLDRQDLLDCSALAGATPYQDMLAVLCGDVLLLLDQQGNLIERLGGVPGKVSALALLDGRILLRGDTLMYGLDDSSGGWVSLKEFASPNWLQARPLPPALRDHLSAANPVPGLTRERVLLDLHSGRLFGAAGVWVVDVTGVLICLLAFSGALTWFGRKWRHRKRR